MPLLLLLLFVGLPAFSQTATNSSVVTNVQSPLVWDPPSIAYTAKQGDVGARFLFKVKNVGPTEILIDDVKPSCGCTAAPMPSRPWKLAPGETNKLDVVVDLRDKTGTLSPAGAFLKEIQVRTATFTNSLSIAITYPGGLTNNMSPEMAARLWGQQLAAVDHQAVFKNDCVKCHLVPAFGKSGEYLFHTTCGICHEAKNRATVVPDLHSLKTEIDTNYWPTWITYGKAGTLMPGFAATEGGPLDDAQIKSLVDYVTNAFPRPIKEVPPKAAK